MVNPVILLMRWLQIIPIALLMISPFTDLKLWLGERYRRFITVSFTILGCAALGALSIASVARDWNWDLCLAALLAIYFSGWLCAVHTSTAHKLLAGGVMLHYASASLIAEKHGGIARFEQMDKAFIALAVLCMSTAAD